ncbi:MAG TPA: DUF222 domain-containing protein, partial [Acidimicrobiia bacterium]|nr:DUF222 domain-containing protein [Acidimicrobiia bacterium]
FEPCTLTHGQAARVVDELGVIHRLTEGLLARAAKRLAETSGTGRGSERDAARCYARAVGIDASEAKRAIVTARRLEDLPETAAAVREGRLSARQAQLVAEAAVHDPSAERDLLDAAAEGMVPLKDACIAARARVEDPAERAARQHAARGLRMWSAADGMVEGHFRLTPEVGGQVKAAIDAGVQRIFRAHRTRGPHERHEAYAADALAVLLLGAPSERTSTAITTHVVIDHAALVRGNALPGERCEIPGVGPVNVEWVRSLLGEAFLTAIVKNGRDITTVAHLGRHIPAHLRTAMIVGGRECSAEGCHNRGYLELDHERDFAKGGPAAWWNLDWYCSVDHDRKTRGWNLGPRDPETGKRTLTPPARAGPQAA